MKKRILTLVSFIIITFLFYNTQAIADDMTITDKDPSVISRALATKSLALLFNDKSSIEAMDRELSYTDTNKDYWYDKYINIAKISNYINDYGNEFKPNQPLTVGEAQYMLNKISSKVILEESDINAYISYSSWSNAIKKALENLSEENNIEKSFGIKEKSIIVLSTADTDKVLSEHYFITDTGVLSSEGLSLSEYIDKEIRVLVKNDEIISILGIISENPVIKNAYVVETLNNTITIYSGGARRTYDITNDSADYKNKICDIEINKGKVKILKVYEEKISSTIKRVDVSEVELEKIGTIRFTEDAKIYSLASGYIEWKNIASLTVGTDIAYYTLDDGHVNAAIITKTSKPLKIRVALSTTGFSSLYHKEVNLTATENFMLISDIKTKEYKAGETIKFPINEDEFGTGRITISTKTDNGKIKLNNIKRNGTFPAYRGSMEVSKTSSGYVVVNELSLEEYLYAVVPSEMPTSHGLEAAKVQAVTARSYAFNQYYANKYHKYGANVDDSVNCQVYNNTPENDNSINAVNSTNGMCITYNGNVVSANFFSTSAGSTANSGEVWANASTKQFPANTSKYLQATKQYENADYGQLNIEENADKFFRAMDVDSYDRDFAWFRWNLELTKEELTASINTNLKSRYQANPSLIKTLQEDGVFRSKYIDTIGDVLDISVVKRGIGGNIMQLKIVGSKATIMVYTEYSIRFLIKPTKYISGGRDVVITRKDGSKAKNLSVLPSAFFTMDKDFDTDGNITKIKIFGGGNGHGVGMSQNGVKGMMDRGYNFEQIILHYYKDTKIEVKI